MSTRLRWVFACAFAVLAISAVVSLRAVARLVRNNGGTAHSNAIASELDRTLSTLKDVEVGDRGYLVTGDERYLAPYIAAISNIDEHKRHLRELLRGDAAQEPLLAMLEQMIDARVAAAKELVQIARTRGRLDPGVSEEMTRGKALMDSIRADMARMAMIEQQRRYALDRETRQSSWQLELTIAAVAAAAFVMFAAVYWGAHTDIRKRQQFADKQADLLRREQDLRQRTESLNSELEQRVQQRTAELRVALDELQSFSYSMAHDLRTPLRGMDGYSQVLLQDHAGQLDEEGHFFLQRIRANTHQMGQLIDDLLTLIRVAKSDLKSEPVDLSALAEGIVAHLQEGTPERKVEVAIEPGLRVTGDPHLLQVALAHLLENSWKFTEKTKQPRIEVGAHRTGRAVTYFVRDNGAGFDMQFSDKLFRPFQRLHTVREFGGNGVGLATVQRIIARHGGRVWGQGAVDGGATFYFTLQEYIHGRA